MDVPPWRKKERSDPASLASALLRYREENKKLSAQLQRLGDQLRRKEEHTQEAVERQSVMIQTQESFFQQEHSMQQQVLDMQRRLDRLIDLQASATRKYDKQVKLNEQLQQKNQDLAVELAALEQKHRQAEARIQLLRQQMLERTPRKVDAGRVKPRDFQQWMEERDQLLSQVAVLTHENEKLKTVVQRAMGKYKHLKAELAELSPAFFQEIEDLKFDLHQERLRSKALETQLAEASRR
eukprot:m.51998 g.51998  ORF g.51998 m.51998 type:complete len:239 (+) comp12668_c1_seq1:97-813(+)